jgi:hypothetical protein
MNSDKRRAYIEGWIDGTRERSPANQWGTAETTAVYLRGHARGAEDMARVLAEADKEGLCKTG